MNKKRHGYTRDMTRIANVGSRIAREMWGILVRRVDINTNKLRVSQKDVAKEMGKTPSQISKAFKILKEHDIIRLNDTKEIFFNPYIMFYAEYDEDKIDNWMEDFNGDNVIYPLPMHKEWGHPNKEQDATDK